MSKKRTYSGSLSIYFPCKLKKSIELSHINKMWDRLRRTQISQIHSRRSPMTDLMDEDDFRVQNEYVLSILQCMLPADGSIRLQCSPYATECVRTAYRSLREDNIFTKNASSVLSRFQMGYEDIIVDGMLLLNVNADNNVATFIFILNFNDRTADDIIRLKHLFYYRRLVSIQVYAIRENVCSGHCFSCCGVNAGADIRDMLSTTIQDFIATQFPYLLQGF